MASISKYPPISTWETLLQRPTQSVEAIEAIVEEVFFSGQTRRGCGHYSLYQTV